MSPALMPSNRTTLVPLPFQGLLDRGSDAFTVLLLVVDHGNGFRLDVVGNEVTCGWTLQAVQTDGAEDQLIATRGDVRAGRRRGDHQNAFVFVNVRRRLSGAGAEVADHEFDFVVDDFVGHGNRLLRVAGIVINHAFELRAIHPTGFVDLLDGHFGTDELHLTVLRDGAGDRACQANFDGVSRYRVAGNASHGHGGKQFGNLLSSLVHSAPLLLVLIIVVLAAKAAEPGCFPRPFPRQLYRCSVERCFAA